MKINLLHIYAVQFKVAIHCKNSPTEALSIMQEHATHMQMYDISRYNSSYYVIASLV